MPRGGDSEYHNFLSLPVSDDQSAARNFVRRTNASRLSVSNFMQLEIICAELHFKLPISKTISFEELARIVEAEYSFKTGEIITCCILCSDNWIPFHLDWIVGKHVTCDSTIRVFSYTDGNQFLFLIISQQNRIWFE
jgi:hypothetical protein